MKKRSERLALTDKFMGEFYNFGNITNIIAQMDDDVIGFGVQSMDYILGKAAMEKFLWDAHAILAPCRIAKMRLKETETAGGCTVSVHVILRTVRGDVLHRVMIMYKKRENGYRITGFHISRDSRHEGIYRRFSSKLMSRDKIPVDAGNREAVETVTSYVDCAYLAYRMNAEHSLEFYNDEFWKMLEYSSAKEFAAASKKTLMQVICEEDRQRIQNELTRQLIKKGGYQLEYRMKKKDGSLIWVMECGQRTLAEDGRAVLNSILMDITPIRKTNESLIYRVSFDDLTGIYNKAAFYQKAQEVISLHPEITFEIMRIDVERFKVINDLFGEKAGDDLLQYIAGFFRHLNLPLCVYGRLHSDNFVVCFPAENENRQRFITSLRAMASSFSLDYRIVLCFGVYRVEDRNLPVSVMCDRASLALNKVKGNGLLVCGEYDEMMRQHIVNEQEIINTMSDALENGEFIVYLQPKYELVTERIIGAEALVRWIHPSRGFVSPADFIPVFEHNGFIFKLDQYVWEASCKLMRKWMDEGKQPLPISVNVSRVDMSNSNLTKILLNLTKKYDLPPQLLELEITESAYMDNPQQIVKVTKELQRLGFTILMDDFGSGYSSLNMLKDLPVDILKIDLKFLDSNDKSGRGGNILNSIVRMAKWLRIPVIAEGVETRQQAEFLRTIGCNFVQGYYYSRPVCVADYEKLIQDTDYREIENPSQSWLDFTDIEDFLNPNAQFNLLFNSISSGIGLYELQGSHLELLRANDGYFDIFGYEREDAHKNGHDILAFLEEEERKTFLNAIHEARNTDLVTHCHLRSHRVDGEPLCLHVRIRMVVGQQEHHLLYLAVEDITELQKRTMELEALFDNIPAGIGVYELKDDRIWTHFLSRGIHSLNQQTKDEFQWELHGDLEKLVGKEIVDAFKKEIVRAYEEKRTAKLDYTFVQPDGQKKELRAVFNTVKGDQDNYFCYVLLKERN